MAVRLGVVNVDAMLRSLTAKQFQEWVHYAALEPFDDTRADYRAASIVQMLYNANRGKDAKPMTLSDAVLKFGEQEPKKKQTWEMQLAIARSMTAAANAMAKQPVKDK